MKRGGKYQLKFSEFRILFLIVGLVLALIVASFALNFISIPAGEEPFSELWLLGSEHKAENYPFNVSVNEEYKLYVGVGNHLGESAYYAVRIKLGNQTHQLPNSTTTESSPLPPLHEFHFTLSDGEVWEVPLTFAAKYALLRENITLLQSISINGMVFPVDYTSIWDSERNGFYYRLFFELCLYDMTTGDFRYHGNSVGLWLNMTSS